MQTENEIQAKELILQAFRLLAGDNYTNDLKIISLTHNGLSHSIEGEIMIDHRNKTIIANAQFRFPNMYTKTNESISESYISGDINGIKSM